jgi:hypothetical protein
MVTAYERALNVIEKKNVEFNFKRLGTFTVTGSSVTRDVRIFPNPSCSCPETKICYHVMAVRLACGLGNIASKKCPNTTRLRKNAKKRADKTSGRKRLRPDDLDGTTSLWENLNGDRCGSDGYDSSCNQNGSSNKEAKETSPPKKKIKTYSKSVLKKNKESQCATEQSTHNFPKNVPVESKEHSIGNNSKDQGSVCQ